MNNLGTVILKTERLILRRFKEKDAEELYFGFINQPEFLYYANKEKRTLDEQKKSLVGINEKYKNLEYYNWLIVLKDTNKIIGSINLHINNFNDSVEFNYAIDNRFIGNGYMTEALLEIKNFALNQMQVNRFQGGCAVENIASKRVMEKCGMQYEGTFKKYLKLKDGYHDMHMFAITN